MTTPDNQRKTCLVTGGTGAIGKAIGKLIALKPGYEVVILGRDEPKTARVTKEIASQTGNRNVRYVIADVSRANEVRRLVENWEGGLHILINNASTTPRRRLETPEGIELQFATNVLGYFWMTLVFADILKASAPARVVNVASYWAGGLDMNDLEFKRRRYDNGSAYRQSKQAERMLTAAFAKQFQPFNITVNACHPGDVNSKLSNDLGFGGHESPDEGARTPVWLATEPIGGEVSGKYFEHLRESHCPFMRDKEAVEALYQVCLEYLEKFG